MKLPRDLSGEGLVKALKIVGYSVTRQSGSHLRLTATEGGEHHVTVPRHHPLRVGTLAAILDDVAAHLGISRDELLGRIRL
ncbi:MAG TPA: type II toxin-antitoxin system HicA family toxin [Pyrinomonadaceae bacterium]|nr:type II toxin-antitoxin system HicA family toxin [Pyrinomonadaceae bacterium]